MTNYRTKRELYIFHFGEWKIVMDNMKINFNDNSDLIFNKLEGEGIFYRYWSNIGNELNFDKMNMKNKIIIFNHLRTEGKIVKD